MTENRDRITRLICQGLDLRVYTVSTLGAAKEITGIHNTTPNATVALGRSITAALLLSATLKPDSEQTLSYRIEGNGPLKGLNVQADAKGNVRGFVSNPDIDLTSDIGSINFGKSIGAGLLTVVKNVSRGESPYTSISPLLYGEVAADTAYYLTTSEQIPSAVIIGMKLDEDGKVAASGGILIQTFPSTRENAIETVEENIKNSGVSLSNFLLENDVNDYLPKILGPEKIETLSTTEVRHNCRCSKEMLSGIIKTLDNNEVQKMISEDNGAEIVCTFCKTKYHFTGDELFHIISGFTAATEK